MITKDPSFNKPQAYVPHRKNADENKYNRENYVDPEQFGTETEQINKRQF